MAATLDPAAMVAGFAGALARLDDAFALGRALAPDIDRIVMVAAGSANRAMLGIQYWVERESPSLEARRWFPAEFVTQNPAKLDARTLVLLASKSGTTKETLAAGEWLKGKPCRTVAFTQRPDKPLATLADHVFTIGETPESFPSLFMLMQALVAGLMEAKDGWALAGPLMQGLRALPAAAADAASRGDTRGQAVAERFKSAEVMYHLASGPGFTSAYVFGVCIVMEMLQIHSTALEAAEFFHGPFEVLDHDTNLILIVGEDPSRPLMERVVRFCEKHQPRYEIYDSKDFPMPGVPAEVRGIVAPYVLQAALKRISANLSILRDKPLGERRYMWKGDY